MPLIAFKGLDSDNVLNRSEVINKICEIYKEIVGVDTCDMETSLDDLEQTVKEEIIAKASAYYNCEIETASIHTCGDLVGWIMDHDGATTGDLLRMNLWNSNPMNEAYDVLRTASYLCAQGYSAEGFLGKIGDVFLSMANTFKTNVFKFTKALKRSEMRLFNDGNFFLCKQVDSSQFTAVMDIDVDIPTGMITTYANAVRYIGSVYEQLDALNYGINVKDAIAEVRYKLYNNNLDPTKSFSPSNLVAGKDAVLKKAVDEQKKCYKDNGPCVKIKFKSAYSSMDEFAKVKSSLLDMEGRLQDVNKFVNVMDDTSATIGDITNYLQQCQLPPQFIRMLADSIRIVGASFDLYGQTVMRQMALEHNHIINYQNLYKLL